MKEKISLGIIGLGCRGYGMVSDIFCHREEAHITVLCDLYQDRVERAEEKVKEQCGYCPDGTLDYREILARGDVDAVVIMSAWESHIPIAIAAMKAGKAVAMEVGGAYSVEDCWQLVHTQEETGATFMFLENCCFGRRELMALHMVQQGVLGKIVHCDGGYQHDLRQEVAFGEENRHYRLRNYLNRNCENYPTHELGPIARILDVNHGNRMVSLVSMASGAWGMNEFAREKNIEKLEQARFAQGDVVTTVIRCAGGETIRLTLDTTLPRYYTRDFTIHGTKGLYEERTRSVFLNGADNEFDWQPSWGNENQFQEQYEHPIWKQYLAEGVQGGHDGMDWLTYGGFLKALQNGEQMPLDVYDGAAWMCIAALSEASIAKGGAPMEIPDFTCGKWINR